MYYVKQNFENGNKLEDSQLNYVEDGIVDLYKQTSCGHHCLNKPYEFNGKKALFFGDSITYGFVKATGAQATNGGYPKIFSEKVGLNFTNNGASGSTLGAKYEGYPYIFEKIQSRVSHYATTDYIFIAGGINDWQLGIDLDTFRAGVEAICAYLKENYTKEVIFITPINHSGRAPTNTPVGEVQDYRDIITEVALMNGYSVVQGNLFNFPTAHNTEAYQVSMFGDDLHPTELGYEMYAKSLLTALC